MTDGTSKKKANAANLGSFMEDLMNEKPFTPSVAKDMVDEGKAFSETAAGKQLQGELHELKKQLEAAEKAVRENLEKFKKKEEEMDKKLDEEKKLATEREERIKKELSDKLEKMDKEQRQERENHRSSIQQMQDSAAADRRQAQAEADRRERDMIDRHERERQQLMASNANAPTDHSAQLRKLAATLAKLQKERTAESKALKKVQRDLDRTASTQKKISQKRLKCETDSQPDDIPIQKSLSSLRDPLKQPNFLQIKGEQPWSTRRIRVTEQILGESAVIASFQEALVRQVNDLAELLGADWSWTGVGRDDGIAAGEFCPIFFKNDVKLIATDSFWLSNTPFEPSKFPGASSFRVCTVARFSTTSATNAHNAFTILNTHLDDWSDEQRRLGASLLFTRARFEAVTTSAPVFITGDFNSTPTGRNSGAYNILTGVTKPVPIDPTFAAKYAVPPVELPDFKMLDLRSQTPRHSVSANFATFTGFNAPHDTSQWTRIDFIFGGSNGGWTAKGYRVVTALADDGLLASDHRPVFADVSI